MGENQEKEEIEVREYRVTVGKRNDWSLSIEKNDYDKEPRIEFRGHPLISEFREAFNVLSKCEITT